MPIQDELLLTEAEQEQAFADYYLNMKVNIVKVKFDKYLCLIQLSKALKLVGEWLEGMLGDNIPDQDILNQIAVFAAQCKNGDK